MTTKKQNREILNKLEEKIDKVKIEKILKNLESLPTKEICDKDGNINFKKFHARQEIKDAVKELKQLGVVKGYLREHGFVIADIMIGGLL